jgi:uncharacterized membrane protein
VSGRGVRAERGVRIERVIEGALTVGLLLSSSLFILGLALGTSAPLKWGILLLMLTPVARVVILTVGLLHERDFRFGLVSLFVLGVLLSGIVVSGHLAPRHVPPAGAPERLR